MAHDLLVFVLVWAALALFLVLFLTRLMGKQNRSDEKEWRR